MQIFYANIKTKGEDGVTHIERTEMQQAIVDYGALQQSPVQESTDQPQLLDIADVRNLLLHSSCCLILTGVGLFDFLAIQSSFVVVTISGVAPAWTVGIIRQCQRC